MSDIDSTNFYRVLGLEPSADARAIKKAYFTLVRKYAPETHPEQFMKLREAYEVLSDPKSREEYDSIGQGGEGDGDEVREQVRLATEALEQGQHTEAQAILARLINQHPELDFARDLLGMAFLHGKQFDAALEIFEELVVKRPENGAYQLHRGNAHHAKKELKAAETAYRKAAELSPDDTRPLAALSDCLSDQKRYDEALQVLHTAIHLDGSVDFRDFGLFVRKLEVEIEKEDSAAMASTLEQLMKIVPDEEPSKRFVANRLASLAAPLFAMKRTNDANLLMREAAKLDPKRGTGQMPDRFEVEIDQLPEATKAWLKEQKTAASIDKISNSTTGWPVVGLLAAVGGLWFCFATSYASQAPLRPGQPLQLFVALVLCGITAAWAIRALLEASKSPYGAYTYVHPLYLLQVYVWKMTAWPLANLHDVRIVHHHTNGVYTTTRIELLFNGKTFNLSIYGKERAVEFAEGVLAKRRRMLELMHAELLEASEDSQLIPSALIPASGKPVATEAAKKRKKRAWVASAALTAASGLAVLGAVVVDAPKADHRAWEKVSARFYSGPRVPGYQKYLDAYPTGRHVDEAKKAIDAVYANAEARVQQHQTSELAPAMLDLIKAMRAKQASKVDVKYEATTLFDKLDMEKMPEEWKGSLIDPKGAFTPSANQARERKITESLDQAFRQVLGEGVISVSSKGSKAGGDYGYRSYDDDDYGTTKKKEKEVAAPVTLVVRYEVALTGSIYESVKQKNQYGKESNLADKKFLGIAFLWEFGMKFEGDADPRYTFEFESQPSKNIHWTTRTSRYGAYHESPTLPYDKMAESGFEDFQHQINVRFGTAQPKPRDAYAEEDTYDDEEEAPAPPPKPKSKPKAPLAKPKK